MIKGISSPFISVTSQRFSTFSPEKQHSRAGRSYLSWDIKPTNAVVAASSPPQRWIP